MSGAAEQAGQPPDKIIHEDSGPINSGVPGAQLQPPTQGAFSHPAQAALTPSGTTAASGGVGFASPGAGHEGRTESTTAAVQKQPEPVGFVRPSDLLRRPGGQSRPMHPLSAVDREQLEGLVRF